MTHERSPASSGTPPVPDARESGPATGSRVYEPPAVLWAQAFVALAQVSFRDDFGCDIPASCPDLP
ncbi:hypothetical protein JQX13_41490 [Archangium violaceum]|uniref:hypothetical protein n=1 Tax=Archangium violaceum TaxID=83451 RepID=UPI00193C0C3E|nr:hypothetical protein [Archangium violaceum]QRK06505.1 hypothetical protein JQX13_41490 [Archangium violaceum]